MVMHVEVADRSARSEGGCDGYCHSCLISARVLQGQSDVEGATKIRQLKLTAGQMTVERPLGSPVSATAAIDAYGSVEEVVVVSPS